MLALELLIVALVYVASLLFGQRLIGLLFPDAPEVAFVVSAIVASLLAGWMYHRRERHRAPASVMLIVGGLLAVLAVVMGLVTQGLWEIMALPGVSIPMAGIGTFLFPLALFGTMRAALRDAPVGGKRVNVRHVLIAGVSTVVLCVVAWLMPIPGRSRATLTEQSFAGLDIKLPNWPTAERSEFFDNGNIKLVEPGGSEGFVALRWTDSDPVQEEDYVKTITGNLLVVRDRESTAVGGHEGTTFLLDSPKIQGPTVCTIWNCPQDHRVFWILTHLDAPMTAVQATHHDIVESAFCHTLKDRPKLTRVFPNFVPPSQFTADPRADAMNFYGPGKEMIVFAPGSSGRNALTDSTVQPAVIANQLTGLGTLQTLDSVPTSRTMTDAQGHERKIWSASGTTPAKEAVQVELMVWYCDVRDMTFIGLYATPGKHEIRQGVEALLPAVCHTQR